MNELGNLFFGALRYLFGCRDEAETMAERNRKMAQQQLELWQKKTCDEIADDFRPLYGDLQKYR